MTDTTIKGLKPSVETFDGSELTVLIIHARWNDTIISSLVNGTVQKLLSNGVKRENIRIETVPGSYELPMACASLIASSSSISAVIAIGCLIKGHTSHYKYISSAVTQGLMRVQLDSGVPVIYGVLNCLTDEQALLRAGIGGKDGNEGHNHGEDWGAAAVELACKCRKWKSA
ncbi:BQ2448_7880 [Microbotryum intermedium]|uniref:6,7-dimethyl-8-ribityllumazine synthase n=1 Tax=Microbotryum intermedium TaxID=269621 RepID=A0A238FRL7_9BASI|nr:BQ2448_7880 [Microbotryum intermedium]